MDDAKSPQWVVVEHLRQCGDTQLAAVEHQAQCRNISQRGSGTPEMTGSNRNEQHWKQVITQSHQSEQQWDKSNDAEPP